MLEFPRLCVFAIGPEVFRLAGRHAGNYFGVAMRAALRRQARSASPQLSPPPAAWAESILVSPGDELKEAKGQFP